MFPYWDDLNLAGTTSHGRVGSLSGVLVAKCDAETSFTRLGDESPNVLRTP